MGNGIVETTARSRSTEDRQLVSILPAQVINNVDRRQEGLVQVHIGSLLGQEQWVRVAAPMAGGDRGICFYPQVGDEVLVAFYQGSPLDSYIIGSLWNRQDALPAQVANDPANQSMIRTPGGHEIAFDDKARSINITSAGGGHVRLAPEKIEIVIGQSSITLEKNGSIKIKASNTITLQAQTINITADQNIAISGKSSARIDGGSNFSVSATQIFIG